MKNKKLRAVGVFLVIVCAVSFVLAFSEETKRRLSKVDKKLAKKFVVIEREMKQKFPQYDTEVTSGYRTCAEQDELYRIGRDGSGRKKVTNAKCGQSFHNYGMAIDVVPFKNGRFVWDDEIYWASLSRVVKKNGLVSGRDFKIVDSPHIQLGNRLPKNVIRDNQTQNPDKPSNKKPRPQKTKTRKPSPPTIQKVRQMLYRGLKQLGF